MMRYDIREMCLYDEICLYDGMCLYDRMHNEIVRVRMCAYHKKSLDTYMKCVRCYDYLARAQGIR